MWVFLVVGALVSMLVTPTFREMTRDPDYVTYGSNSEGFIATILS